jgi:hypothetical protein
MYGSSCTIRINKLANGFTVSMTDPEIVKANKKREEKRKPDSPYPPWRDPEVTMAFEDADSVITFLKDNLDKAMPNDDDYETSFTKALKE